MAAYSILEFGIRRNADSTFIPIDPNNRDYADYLDWVSQGNVADPYVVDPSIAIRAARKATFDADATRADLIAKLTSSTPAQISTYVDNNVTNLAEARAMFKKILLVLSYI
jgi:hypothetical protein